MALHAFVAAHAPLQYPGHVVGLDARAIVLHHQLQAGAPVGSGPVRPGGQQHPVTGPLEGVFQQVAQQFLQVAGLAEELHARGEFEFAQHALARIYLLQPAHDLLGRGFHRHRRGEQLVPAGRGPRQLVGDQVVHALELDVQFLAQPGLAGAGVKLGAQHRQRRLQAVRQVGQGVALAVQVLALGIDQRVDALCQRLELARVALAHALQLATLDPGQLGHHPLQRTQAPVEDHHLQQQQDQAGATQVDPQRGAEHPHLRGQDLRILHHEDRIRELVVRAALTPDQADAVAIDLTLAAIELGHRQRAFEALLARGQLPGHLRQQRPLGRERGPVAVGHQHLGIQAAAGAVEARIGAHVRGVQRTVTSEVDVVRVGHRIAGQALAQVGFGGLGEGAVQGEAGQHQERDQTDAGRGELARLERTRPPAPESESARLHAPALPGRAQPSVRAIANR